MIVIYRVEQHWKSHTLETVQLEVYLSSYLIFYILNLYIQLYKLYTRILKL